MTSYTLYISGAFSLVLLVGLGNFIWYWRKYRALQHKLRQQLQDAP